MLTNPARSAWPNISFSSIAALSLIAAVIGVGSAKVWNAFESRLSSPKSKQIAKEPESYPPAAYLTSANGCNWGRSGRQTIWNVGQGVEAGDEVALNQGIAEFRLASGSYLGAEGPASLLLASPSTLVLQYGKLTSHVPWGSNELKIVAAGCRILARDAEFGINYSSNKLDIHVFSGQVTANSLVGSSNRLLDDQPIEGNFASVDGDNSFTDAVITAGRVLQLTVQGEVLKVAGWSKAEPSSFISKLSMSGPLHVTPEYIDRVLASKPIGYWRFDKFADSRVPNEIPSGPHLRIRYKPSLNGSGDNFAAEFYPNGRFYLSTVTELPLANSDYSLEAWVKPSHLHHGCIAKMYGKQNDRAYGTQLELQGARNESYNRQHPGVIRFRHYRDYHRDENNRPSSIGTSCFSSQDYAMRRWQHVVAVKSGPEMKLYIDGKLQGSASDASTFPSTVRLLVGIDADHQSRRFVGQIDELAVYDRALSKKEISEHFKSVKEAMSSPSPTQARTAATAKPTDT